MNIRKHGHKFHDRDDCLQHCKVCSGAEATLPTECPLRRMTPAEQDQIQNGSLDYINGRWTHIGATLAEKRQAEKLR